MHFLPTAYLVAARYVDAAATFREADAENYTYLID